MCGISRSRDVRLEDLAPRTPAPRRPGGSSQPEQQEMTGPEIRAHLSAVAAYLHGKRQTITVVGVGGVISTLALETRNATHDVDIFFDGVTPEQVKHLKAAIKKVAKKSHLQSDWLNNQTILHIPVDLREVIQRDALQQDYVVFQERGLKVIAAPWLYSFTSKLHRISGAGAGSARVYDPQDAAHFLQRYLQANSRSSLTVTDVKSSMDRYKVQIRDEPLITALTAVNNAAGSVIVVVE